ncbi:16159_t:CDS:2 [Funneliformis caledonium]|uniref:16159_t:CDS:1 n=1 Tax=Funneliformis caledonium TaxID=1117310 RepID=A0A9N9DWB5_9GLOM|nr:16159_t:CDS:2 [Funneliformis caledonium]
MPNATPTSSRKKDKRKSLEVTTEKDFSLVRQETLSPITPAGESSLENKNPYIDVLTKRVKKLRKAMTRIEKYESIKNTPDGINNLNADQINLLERKGETSGAIKEFDEALKQIESVEKEELKKQVEQKKAQQSERDQAIANAVEEATAAHCKSLLRLIQFFNLIHLQHRGFIKLSEIEFEGVEFLRSKLISLTDDAKNEELYEGKIREVLDLVNKLQLGDESLITKSLLNGVNESEETAANNESSTHDSKLLALTQSPPILESPEEPQVEQEEIQEAFEEVPAPHPILQSDDSTNVTIPAGGLQFMYNPDDQSQPLESTINSTTYTYQSTDAEQIPVAPSTSDVMADEQYHQQQQNYDTSTVEQPYIGEQQHFVVEQNDQQQVSTEHNESSQQEEPSLYAQEQQTVSEDLADSKQQPQSIQQDNDQPPPLSQGSSGFRGRAPHRNNRGFRGVRRDSGGYRDNNYRDGGYRDGRDGGGYRENYRDGGYREGGYRDGYRDGGGFRGRGTGPRGGGRGAYSGGNRGGQFRQRSQ